MQFLDMRKWNRSAILALYGIPPILIGVKDEQSPLSGTDTKEQQRGFWTNTMEPLAREIEYKLKVNFFDRYAPQYRAEFDDAEIEELKMNIFDKIDTATKLFAIQFTANEINDKLDLGFEDKPWREFAYKPFALEQIPPTGIEEPKPAPQPLLPPGQPPRQIQPPKQKTIYNDRFMVREFARQHRGWEKLYANYGKALEKWIYEARSWYLAQFAKSLEVCKTYDEFVFWIEHLKVLKDVSKKFFYQALDLAQVDITITYQQVGWEGTFDIYASPAVAMAEARLDRLSMIKDTIAEKMKDVIDEGVRANLTKEELAAQIRDTFNVAQGRADTIANTELEAIKNESRYSAWQDGGFEYHTWWHDPTVEHPRDQHIELDGTTRKVGEPWQTSTGFNLLYPHDPSAPASEVINCMCQTFPEMGPI